MRFYLLLFIAVLLLLGNFVSAQRMSIDVYVNSNYSFPSIEDTYQIKSSNYAGVNGFVVQTTNIGDIIRTSTGEIGFELGFNFNIPVGERIKASIGLEYSLLRYTEKINVTTKTDVSSLANSGFTIDSIGNSSSHKILLYINSGYNLGYLKIPLLFSFSPINKLKLSSGLTINLLTNSVISTNYNYSDWDNTDKSGLGLSNFTLNATINISYLIYESFSISASYQRGLNSLYNVNEQPGISYKAYNNSLSIGLVYGIGNIFHINEKI